MAQHNILNNNTVGFLTNSDVHFLLPIRNGNYTIFINCKILTGIISMKINAITCSVKKVSIVCNLISVFWAVSVILMQALGDEFDLGLIKEMQAPDWSEGRKVHEQNHGSKTEGCTRQKEE